MLLIRWRLSSEFNTFYNVINLRPTRPDAAFVGYTNMWLNLTNNNLVNDTVVCLVYKQSGFGVSIKITKIIQRMSLVTYAV